MPNKASAKKALRQSESRRGHNAVKMRVLKDSIKSCKKVAEKGDSSEAKTILSVAYKKLDKAAKTNLIKKNKANRLKSRLTKLISKSKEVKTA